MDNIYIYLVIFVVLFGFGDGDAGGITKKLIREISRIRSKEHHHHHHHHHHHSHHEPKNGFQVVHDDREEIFKRDIEFKDDKNQESLKQVAAEASPKITPVNVDNALKSTPSQLQKPDPLVTLSGVLATEENIYQPEGLNSEPIQNIKDIGTDLVISATTIEGILWHGWKVVVITSGTKEQDNVFALVSDALVSANSVFSSRGYSFGLVPIYVDENQAWCNNAGIKETPSVVVYHNQVKWADAKLDELISNPSKDNAHKIIYNILDTATKRVKDEL
jgi:hypothetical protein